MTANAFMSVSLRPPLIVISVDRRAKMHALLNEGRRYGISVLADEQRALSDRFAGRTADGPEEVEFELVHETPLVRGALAHLVARVVRSYWGGDTRCSWARWSTPGTGRGSRCCSTAGGTSTCSGARRCSRRSRRRSEAITAQGEEQSRGRRPGRAGGCPGDELYVILEGSADVMRGGTRAGDVRCGGVLRRDRGARRAAPERRRDGHVRVARARDLARSPAGRDGAPAARSVGDARGAGRAAPRRLIEDPDRLRDLSAPSGDHVDVDVRGASDQPIDERPRTSACHRDRSDSPTTIWVTCCWYANEGCSRRGRPPYERSRTRRPAPSRAGGSARASRRLDPLHSSRGRRADPSGPVGDPSPPVGSGSSDVSGRDTHTRIRSRVSGVPVLDQRRRSSSSTWFATRIRASSRSAVRFSIVKNRWSASSAFRGSG